MQLNTICILIFLIFFCFLCFQYFEIYQNKNYIIAFNNRYSIYEYGATPSYNYADKSLLDPNDNMINVDDKWRCGKNSNLYYGFSKNGLIIHENNFIKWDIEIDCINYIFDSYFLNYIDPCIQNENNLYCNIFKSLKQQL